MPNPPCRFLGARGPFLLGSHHFDDHVPSVDRESAQVSVVASKDSASRLRHRYNDGVNSRAAARSTPQLSRPTRNRVRQEGSTMHVLMKRFTFASRSGRPWRHSTSTTVGTTGGHRSAATRPRMSASAWAFLAASRVTPPLSRTSTSDCLIEVAIPDLSNDRFGPGPVASGGFAYLGLQLGKVLLRGVQSLPTLNLSPHRDLEQLGRRQVAPLQLVIQLIREVHLKARHTPKYTPISGRWWCPAVAGQGAGIPWTLESRHPPRRGCRRSASAGLAPR